MIYEYRLIFICQQFVVVFYPRYVFSSSCLYFLQLLKLINELLHIIFTTVGSLSTALAKIFKQQTQYPCIREGSVNIAVSQMDIRVSCHTNHYAPPPPYLHSLGCVVRVTS